MNQQQAPLDKTAKGIRRQQAFQLATAFAASLTARVPHDQQIDADALTNAVVQLTKMQLSKLLNASIID